MDEELTELVTVSTRLGLCRYIRLMFGVTSAAVVFQ